MLYCQLPSMGDNLGAAGALGRRPAVSHLLQLRPEGLRATRQQFVSMWSWTRPCTHMTHRAYALLSTALEGRQSGRSRSPRASSCCEPSVAAAALRHADYREPSKGYNLGAAGALGRHPAVSHLWQPQPSGMRTTGQQFVRMAAALTGFGLPCVLLPARRGSPPKGIGCREPS